MIVKRRVTTVSKVPQSLDVPASRGRADDARSLDLVQRLVISTLLVVVLGAPTAALAFYGPVLGQTDRASGLGLLVMCGIIGLTGVTAVRVVHRRSTFSAYLLLGLLPAAVSAFYLF
jgi:hypothetical protein